MPGLVSTIIPVFNRAALLVESVESVLAQSYRPIEILIVDDGSTDDTSSVIKALSEQYSEIRVLSQANAGPASARENGRLHARGEYVQYLDSDDILLSCKFEYQVKALLDDPRADIAYGKTEVVKLGQKPKGQAARRTGEYQQTMFPLFLRERWWFTSTPLYRQRVLAKVGAWANLINEEDWEYDCRVAALGGRLAYVDDFVSLHRVHDNHLSSGGASSDDKLRARAVARAKIYQHAKSHTALDGRPSHISEQDWLFFSKYTFLLARQCALAGLTAESKALVSLSIKAIGRKRPQHFVFLSLSKLIGWQRASRFVEWINLKGRSRAQ